MRNCIFCNRRMGLSGVQRLAATLNGIAEQPVAECVEDSQLLQNDG